MNRPKERKVALAEPRQALMGYLQTLLDEVPERLEEERAPRPAVKLEPPVTERKPAAVQAPPQPAPAPVTEPAPEQVPEQTVAPVPAIPDWGRRPFQAIGFETAGIALCLPLEQLSGIVRWDGGLTRLPGMPPWQLGILQVRGSRVVVIDFARLLMPDRAAAARGHVLLLEGERWGLACERVAETLDVRPEAVRWRRNPGKPPFLLGVISDSLTPIVGVAELLDRFAGE